jgi:WW domain/U1 zinc finger
MPRFFDDYSNTYLTHDSSAGRKQQRRGWKFRENFRLHYQRYMQDWRRGEMGLASAQQAYIRARGKDDAAIPPLPDGWREFVDDVTGISYYVDTTSGKRTWVRPAFIPPPPGQAPPPNRGPPRHGVGVQPMQHLNTGSGVPQFGPNFVGGQSGPPGNNFNPYQPPKQSQTLGHLQQQFPNQSRPPPPAFPGNLPLPPQPSSY